MTSMTIMAGGDIDDDGAAFLQAWQRAERGEAAAGRVLAFESWDGLTRMLTGERFRLLRHVHRNPAPSISALARPLDRQQRRVHADATTLEQAGLLERSADGLRTAADHISAEIWL